MNCIISLVCLLIVGLVETRGIESDIGKLKTRKNQLEVRFI